MELLEYQAKQLFKQIGIPVLPSQTFNDPRDLKQLNIPLPVVLKSQVRVGGRGKAGGIRFVENTIDAIAAARSIFNLPILGQYPQTILAEARYDAEKEIFLAIVLDYQIQRPVLLGSATGGMDVELLLANLKKVVVTDTFSPFYARRLTTQMGLQGNLIQSVSKIVEQMYDLFLDYDLDLIEINPLGVSLEGELMALDGKITVNDTALKRHPDLVFLTESKPNINYKLALELATKTIPIEAKNSQSQKLEGIENNADLAIICNGWGLALETWDLIHEAKGKINCCFIIGQDTTRELVTQDIINEQMQEALIEISKQKKIKTVLINFITELAIAQVIIDSLSKHWQINLETTAISPGEERSFRPTGSLSPTRNRPSSPSLNNINQDLKIVLRLVSDQLESIQEYLHTLPFYWTDDLEKAVTQTVVKN